MSRKRQLRFVAAVLTVLAAVVGTTALADARLQRGNDQESAAKNVSVVGYSDLAGRGGAFKLAIEERNGRWYMYMGHLWHRGWTILDVTDPSKPQFVKFIPGPFNTWTIQMEVFDHVMLTALENMPASWGGDPTQPFEDGVYIWSLADPVNPQLQGQFRTGGSGTHRNGYYGGKYAFLAAGMKGYSGNIFVAIDISNPSNPVEVSRFWLPGQWVEGGEKPQAGVSLHGPPQVVGSTAYLPYGSGGLVLLDVTDVTKPKQISRLPFTPPFIGGINVHSALPIVSRNLVVVNSESLAEDCNEALNHTSIVDVKNPAKPTLLSVFPIPTPPPGFPYTNFCDKGGRFGPHNQNQNQHSPYVQRADNLVYLTYFNAGLRIYDISDARQPREVGYFVPPKPAVRYGPNPVRVLVSQTEDVLVDARGYIYITDKNEGIWILRFTGPEAP